MPVLTPRFELRLGRCRVQAVESIKVALSRSEPCDKLEIKLPLLSSEDLSKFKKGAAVESETVLKLGYDEPEPMVIFSGVITEISPNQPLVIKCEDHAHALKNIRIQKTFSDVNVYGALGIEETWHSAIAHYVISQAGLTPEVPVYGSSGHGDYKRKTFSVHNHTCFQVLDQLNDIGWDYFCIPGTKKVYFGPPWPWARAVLPQPKRQIFTIGYPGENSEHLPNVISAQSLKFEASQNVGTVKVYVVDSDFSKNQSVVGVAGEGEPVREYDFESSDDNNPQEAANARAQLLYMKLRASAFSGSLEAIGNPRIRHSESVRIDDAKHPLRSGNFYVDEVTHDYGASAGFRTQVKLAQREGSIS